VHYVTLGCSRHPMGDPEAMLTDAVRGPRAELVLAVRGGVDGVLRSMAILAATPTVEGLVLQEDSLVDLQEPLWPGAAFTAVVLLPSAIPALELGAAWVRLRGAAALREAWAEAGIDVLDPGRSAVTL